MKHLYYYYKIDKNGNPLMGTNFKSSKLLKQKNLIRYNPSNLLCCVPTTPEPNNGDMNKQTDNAVYYFVRLDENNKPVNMSLFKSTHPHWFGLYQQVYKFTCCGDLTAYNLALNAVVESDYSPESWSDYMNVVNDNVMTTNNTQTEINTATAAIIAAQTLLTPA